MSHPNVYKIDLSEFDKYFSSLQKAGYSIIGPTVRDQAIIYDELAAVEDLPIGWTDEQDRGTYRIKKRGDKAYFGYNAGPHSWKKYLFPPRRKLWEASRKEGLITLTEEPITPKKMVFLGVRSCEIEAIFIQDKVFIEGNYIDPFYRSQRDHALIIAVNCTKAASTCFCTSMNTGPESQRGFDLSLTEIINGNDHYFIVHIGTEKGRKTLEDISLIPADEKNLVAEKKGIQQAKEQMKKQRGMDTEDLNHLLYRNMENPRWEEVAKRCLSCANCTLVCPTCFCSNTEDVADLTGDHAERWKTWDSCFNPDHSYIHGGSIRDSTKSRYRQWLTHKVGSWIDQFGTSGCVGCGRCIAWCPVGIDIREEIAAIRESDNNERV